MCVCAFLLNCFTQDRLTAFERGSAAMKEERSHNKETAVGEALSLFPFASHLGGGVKSSGGWA